MSGEDFARADAWLRDSLFVQELLKHSHFKEKTFRALLFKTWSGDATFEKIAVRMGINQPGAWKCCQRGQNSILRSFVTLKLALVAGVLSEEVADLFILDLQDFLDSKRGEISEDEFRDRVERRMVTLQRKFEENRYKRRD